MKKILIVDDDAELRSHLIEILSGEGYETDSASSAKEALEKSQMQMFDVVIMDFMMPKMNGIDALQEMRKQHPKTKVIMNTAFASVENAVDAIKKGASDYLSKPFKIPDLLTTIRRVIEETKFEDGVKRLDLDKTCNAIASPIRRNILKLLNDTGPMRLMEITRELSIEDHTKVVFHLKMLKEAGIVEQDREKNYCLSDAGNKAMDCLKKMETLLLD
jgi:DNA-binding response OmpR family regulator